MHIYVHVISSQERADPLTRCEEDATITQAWADSGHLLLSPCEGAVRG